MQLDIGDNIVDIYLSPSIEIGVCSIIIFWVGLYSWEHLVSSKPIKRSFIISVSGILAFLVYAITHITLIYVFKGSGNDSQSMQLVESLILFSLVYSAVIFSRLIVKVNYKIYIIVIVILILAWTVKSILFHTGLQCCPK